MIPEPVLIAFFTTLGSIAAAVVAVYTYRRTAQQTDQATAHDERVEADRTGLEGLKELALQNRQDREEMRRDRTEMMQRLDKAEAEQRRLREEQSALRRRVVQLETERERDRQTIADLRAEIEERKRIRHALQRYIRQLREFIVGLGSTPPDPDEPLPVD